MNRSDWIALAACIAAFLGLIPSFYQTFAQKKKVHRKKNSKNIENTVKTDSEEVEKTEKKEPMPPMLRILTLALTALVVGLIELLIFSAVAHFCGVKVEFTTMTLVWRIVFCSLFLIPGILLFFALMVLTTMFDD